MPIAQGASPRLFLAGFARPRAVPGVFSLLRGLRPSRCRLPIRTGRTLGPCGHTCLRATDIILIIYISRIISIILISHIGGIYDIYGGLKQQRPRGCRHHLRGLAENVEG